MVYVGNNAFFVNNINNVTVPHSILENPLNRGACKYFDVDVNITWNGNNYVCDSNEQT